ncbi:MAG: hypothetical protein A2538_04450 [Candidatus Magasanikbacteria bacterium RIFOXYD2_FULL_41_14]|uniref:EfeO-type cupredoxin-like domain-containing protein n=1 Tax=Candidatus Magasanikbacteria bacterium RIFOXYD2_FULL_41_14 TaxID=1798709 RepID=A0A1F6PEQ6_9BACT|nr:MAG: hypothetical protein A2538_04450 [Candidatus Magasanikbacteria bacterium RIFOXYD2_FULL_41_14]
MNKYLVGLGGLVMALVIVGAGCAPQQAPEEAEKPEANEGVVEATMPVPGLEGEVTETEVVVDTQVTANESATENKVAATAEDAVTFNVGGVNFAFAPKEIKVKKGQKVTVNFTSDMGFHDFVIDEFNVRTPQLKNPGTASVTFTADKVGTFEYYCSVGQHRVNGMVGNLIVE